MKKEKKKKGEPRQITRFNILFVNIQLFLTFFTIGLFIWYLFDSSMIYWFQFFLGITLLVMAYNNQIIYRRKLATILYLVIGVVLLALGIIMYLGVR